MFAPIMCKVSDAPDSGLPIGVFAFAGTPSISAATSIVCRLRGLPSLPARYEMLSPWDGNIRGVGVLGRLIGGVGGMSPVRRTKVSTILHNIFIADPADKTYMSTSPSPGKSALSSVGGNALGWSPGSAEGAGGAGSGGNGLLASLASVNEGVVSWSGASGVCIFCLMSSSTSSG